MVKRWLKIFIERHTNIHNDECAEQPLLVDDLLCKVDE